MVGTGNLNRAQYGPAREYYQEALALAANTDPEEAGGAWHGLATIDLEEGSYPAARDKFERSLAIRQQIGDREGEAVTWHQLASIDIREGLYPAAREKLERSLAMRQQTGDRAGEAAAWHQLASIDLREGNYPAAREKFERVLTIQQRTGDRIGEAAAWHQIASTEYLEKGFNPAAREKCERALAIQQQIGDRVGEAASWQILGAMAIASGAAAGFSLIGLCYLIDREIGHGDAESDLAMVDQYARQLGYTPEQVPTILQETAESYARDRGAELLKQAFA